MRRYLTSVLVAVMSASLLLAGCTQPSSPPSPTQAPAAPTKPAEPTKPVQPTTVPAAAAPTAVPAKKVDFPAGGKAITAIVPWAAGANADLGMRVVASSLEKDLGVPVQVANKAGASGQVGLTEVAKAKPDGYTIGMVSSPAYSVSYLDPERKAGYTRKDFAAVALYAADDGSLGVKSDSSIKTAKDLVDAAKANPGSIKVGTPGLLSGNHMAALVFEEAAGVKFSYVHFDGGAPAITALLGGHVDVVTTTAGIFLPQARSGAVRVLGIMGKEEHKFYPGVKTMEAQGYKAYAGATSGAAVPAGTPKEIVGVLSTAIKQSLEKEEIKKKMDELGLQVRYMDPAQYEAYWVELESQVPKLLQLAKQ